MFKRYKKPIYKIKQILILAAGESKRFGSCKYTEKIGDYPLILWGLKPYIELYVKENLSITIVTGPYYNEIFELLEGTIEPFTKKEIKILKIDDVIENEILKNYLLNNSFYQKNFININLCQNENYKKGMFSSYKKGIKSILSLYKNEKDFTTLNKSIIVSLADMPFISNNLIIKLINRLDSRFTDVVIPCFVSYNKDNYGLNIKKGHPIALKSSFALKTLKYDENLILRDILKTGKTKLIKTLDKGVCFDIDTKEDLLIAERILKLNSIE